VKNVDQLDLPQMRKKMGNEGRAGSQILPKLRKPNNNGTKRKEKVIFPPYFLRSCKMAFGR